MEEVNGGGTWQRYMEPEPEPEQDEGVYLCICEEINAFEMY